jgi:hypothetical protein
MILRRPFAYRLLINSTDLKTSAGQPAEVFFVNHKMHRMRKWMTVRKIAVKYENAPFCEFCESCGSRMFCLNGMDKGSGVV